MGLEDLRIFKKEEDYLYLATSIDPIRRVVSVASNVYSLEDPYTLKRTIMTPSFYDQTIRRVEKNLTFVYYQEKVSVVYAWHPLQIGVFVNTSLNLISVNLCLSFLKRRVVLLRVTEEGPKSGLSYINHKSRCVARFPIISINIFLQSLI